MALSLADRRKALVSKTMDDVANSLKDISKIRSPKRDFELSFKYTLNAAEISAMFKVSSGTVASGNLIISKPGTSSDVYPIIPFPIILLHEVSLRCKELYNSASYIAQNYSLFSNSAVDHFVSELNSAISILSHPKYSEIVVNPFFSFPLPQGMTLTLIYRDENFIAKLDGFPGFPSLECPNLEDSTWISSMDKNLRRVLKILKFLRSDVSTWSLPE